MPRKKKSAAPRAATHALAKPASSLFDDADADAASASAPPTLAVNRRYERSFNERRQRQELERQAERGGPAADEEDESSEDEGGALTAGLDSQIRATIRAIRARDPRIYDASTRFFPVADADAPAADAASGAGSADAAAARPKKPQRAKDVLRQQLVAAAERGETDAFAEEEEEAVAGRGDGAGGRRAVDDGDRGADRRIYDDEQSRLRREFLDSAAARGAGEGGGEREGQRSGADAGDDGGDFLRVRKRSAAEGRADAAAAAADLAALRAKLEAKGGGVAAHGGELRDPEGFLEAMLTSKAWQAIEHEDDEDDDDEGEGVGEDAVGEGGDGGGAGSATGKRKSKSKSKGADADADADVGSESEEELWAAEDFEAAYNFRFEQGAEGAAIVTHARGAAAEGSLRRVDGARKEERARRRERQEELRREKEAETRRLMNAKRAEIKARLSRIRAVAGRSVGVDRLAAVLGDRLDDDFDPAEHDRQMALLFGDEFYGGAEDEGADDGEAAAAAAAAAAAVAGKGKGKGKGSSSSSSSSSGAGAEDAAGEGAGEEDGDDDEEEAETDAAGRPLAPWLFGDGPRPRWAGPSAEELARGADDLGLDVEDGGGSSVPFGDEDEGDEGLGREEEEGGEGEDGDGGAFRDPAVHGQSRRRPREGKRAREGKRKRGLTAIARAKAQLAAEARAARQGPRSAGAFPEAEKDADAVLALGFEDVIAGGLRTRFKYTSVPPQDFGLTTAEILLLDDRDLNAFVGLRRIAPYREQEWVMPARQRHRQLQVLRDKLRDEERRLGLTRPNVVGGSAGGAGGAEADEVEGDGEGEDGGAEEGEGGPSSSSAAADVDAEAGAGAAEEEAEAAPKGETDEERRHRKRRRRQQRKEAAQRAAEAAKTGRPLAAAPGASKKAQERAAAAVQRAREAVVVLPTGRAIKKARLASYGVS